MSRVCRCWDPVLFQSSIQEAKEWLWLLSVTQKSASSYSGSLLARPVKSRTFISTSPCENRHNMQDFTDRLEPRSRAFRAFSETQLSFWPTIIILTAFTAESTQTPNLRYNETRPNLLHLFEQALSLVASCPER